jgi:hypothetical protein
VHFPSAARGHSLPVRVRHTLKHRLVALLVLGLGFTAIAPEPLLRRLPADQRLSPARRSWGGPDRPGLPRRGLSSFLDALQRLRDHHAAHVGILSTQTWHRLVQRFPPNSPYTALSERSPRAERDCPINGVSGPTR